MSKGQAAFLHSRVCSHRAVWQLPPSPTNLSMLSLGALATDWSSTRCFSAAAGYLEQPLSGEEAEAEE